MINAEHRSDIAEPLKSIDRHIFCGVIRDYKNVNMLRALNWPYKAISVITLHSITVIKLQLPLDLCFHSSSGINSLKWLRSIVSFHWREYLDSCSISQKKSHQMKKMTIFLRHSPKIIGSEESQQKYFNRSWHNFWQK